MHSLKLYHHPLSVCSMKTRLALEEKGLDWSGQIIDIVGAQEQLEPWYIKLNPKGVVPTLEVQNGTTNIDLADEVDLQILSYARHPSMENSGKILDTRIEKSLQLAKQYPELKDSYLVCADRSKKSKTFRVDETHVKEIEQNAFAALTFAEKQLEGNTFLLGDSYTLADVIWTVVLSRLDLLGFSDWISGKDFPLLANYYQRAQARESFTTAHIQNTWWDK